MIKLVIVDDEPFILRSIKSEIEQLHAGFEVVGTAYDGEEALAIIEMTSPDVVFSDIRMPIMDGLQLIEHLKTKKSNIITVILSGFQEFEYARKALQLGARDYLLKPIKTAELSNTLNTIYKEISGEKERVQIELLRDILFVHIDHKYEHTEYFSEFRYFRCMFICAGSYSRSGLHQNERFSAFSNSIEAIKQKSLNELRTMDQAWIINGEFINEKIIVLGTKGDSDHHLDSIVGSLYENMIASAILPVTIVSSAFTNVYDLKEIMKHIKRKMPQNIEIGASKLVCNENIREWMEAEDLLNPSCENALKLHMQNKQDMELKKILNQLFADCQTKGYSQIMVEKVIQRILSLYYQVFQSFNKWNRNELEGEVEELLTNATNYEDVYTGVCALIDRMMEQLKSEPQQLDASIVQLIDRIEAYLEANCDQSLSIQEISRNFGISPSYLSHMFKKYKRMSPLRYHTWMRMNKAKLLLQTASHLLIKDIALAVGYDDALYFSRIFKDVIGYNPSEFRTQKNLHDNLR